MSMTETRERGVTLRLLDFSKVEEQGTKIAQRDRGENYRAETGFGPYGYAETTDGRAYVICTEGVGWEVRDDQPLELDLYFKADDSFSIAPNLTARLDLEEVRSCLTDDTIDLADHVRRFGDRLEVNFGIWHRRLSR